LILTDKILFGLIHLFTIVNSGHSSRGPVIAMLMCVIGVFFAQHILMPWNCLPAEQHRDSSSFDLLEFVTRFKLVLSVVNMIVTPCGLSFVFILHK